MILSAHQCNFIPYFPFFQKMEQADIFVLLTETQFRKGGYENRFECNGWNTMSVNSGLEPLKKKMYVNYKEDWKKITDKFPKLHCFDGLQSPSLIYMNLCIISSAATKLGINNQKLRIDRPTNLTGTDRLIEICKRYKADKYLSGISGSKYLDLPKFEEQGIEVVFQDESKMIKKPLVEMI